MKRTVQSRVTAVFLAIAVLVSGQTVTRAATRTAARHRVTRLDATLRTAVENNASGPQRVIIRVRPGSRPGLRNSLVAHGDRIIGEHESIDAITAVVHGEDVGALAD